jgi:hypothetical protein
VSRIGVLFFIIPKTLPDGIKTVGMQKARILMWSSQGELLSLSRCSLA